MCRLGMTVGVSAIAAITSSVKAAGWGEVKRTRSMPSTRPHGTQQVGESAALTEADAVGVDVLSQQGHLDGALRGDGLDLGKNVAGATVTLLAAQVRDDAEGAGVVAAHGDRHPGGVGALAVSGQGRGKDLEGFLDLDGGRAVVLGAAQQRREDVDVVGTEDSVHPGRLLDDAVTHLLGEAAANGDLHAGALALDRGELAEVTEEPGRGVLTNGAGVDNDDVGAHVAGVGRRGRQPRGPARQGRSRPAPAGPPCRSESCSFIWQPSVRTA